MGRGEGDTDWHWRLQLGYQCLPFVLCITILGAVHKWRPNPTLNNSKRWWKMIMNDEKSNESRDHESTQKRPHWASLGSTPTQLSTFGVGQKMTTGWHKTINHHGVSETPKNATSFVDSPLDYWALWQNWPVWRAGRCRGVRRCCHTGGTSPPHWAPCCRTLPPDTSYY